MVNQNVQHCDRFRLRRSDLLAGYAKIAEGRPGALLATALRERSQGYLDIMAAAATRGEMDWAALRNHVSSLDDGKADVKIVPGNLADIGRYLVLRPRDEDDERLGARLLANAMDLVPAKRGNLKYRKLLVEYYIISGQPMAAQTALDRWEDVDEESGGYLRAELDNPHVFPDGSSDQWLGNFNRDFAAAGLWPISVRSGEAHPFDRVCCEPPSSSTETPDVGPSASPLVTVVIPTYRPERQELLTAVGSILDQTLRDIEVIIVDDASPVEYEPLLAEIARSDPRIRVIRAEENAGAYVARNIGYGEARGEFVTGQDDDDWSHPERLERQVRFLQSHPEVSACRAWAVTCLPNLQRARLGYRPTSPNASSVMLAAKDFRRIGGFLEVRKGADTEMHLRLERVTGRPMQDLKQPLTLVRITPDSLSRSEFSAGWAHPARNHFKTSYALWHNESTADELVLESGRPAPLAVPRRFQLKPDENAKYDVVLAGNWRKLGGPQKSMLEEIKALLRAGKRVGIMDLEAARFMKTTADPLNAPIQKLVNSGDVDQVLYDDDVEVSLLILRYPPILQFVPDAASNLRVGRMVILANQAPSETDGTDIRYLVRDCHENAQRIFTPHVTWVPQGPRVREAITPYLGASELEAFDIPGILDVNEWSSSRPRRPRGLVPVIGRHSRDDAMKWPEDMETMKAVYPTSGEPDVRVMGGSKAPLAVLRSRTVPPAWTVHRMNAIPVKQFLNTLDFFVFYQNSKATEAFGRAILEAVAAGLVVILPPHYRDVFGPAALYADPEDVRNLVARYHEDRDLYETQRATARRVMLDRFGYDTYVERIMELMEKQPEGSEQ